MSSSDTIRNFKALVKDVARANSLLNKEREASNGLDHAVLALEKLAIHMASMDYSEVHPCVECGRKGLTAEQTGKTLAYVAKMVNEITRLMQFAKGEADQRSEVVGLGELLKVLTNDQFQQVQTWIGQNQDASQNLLQ